MHAIVADRGQVTIPKRFRDRLGIGPRTVVDFEEDGGRLILKKIVEADPVSKVMGCIRLNNTTDKLIRDIRGDA